MFWLLHGAAVALALAAVGDTPRALTARVAPPSFESVRLLATQVPRFGRAEISIQLRTVASRVYYPYQQTEDGYAHPQGVTVDARITDPVGATTVVPAFFYTPYQRAPVGSDKEAIGIVGRSEWRMRFSPRVAGLHTATITAHDAGGQTTSSPVPFTVQESERRGFIRVSPEDPRFLSYDNGDDFIPIAEGRQWAPSQARLTLSYAEAMKGDAANGVNLTRIWDQNDGFNLAIEGSYPVWAPSWSQFTKALGIDRLTAHSGTRAARFRPTDGPATEGYVQWVAVQPSTAYDLACWIRTSGLKGRGAFVSANAQSLMEPGRIRSAVLTGTHDWTQVRVRFTTGPSQHASLIWVGAEQSSGTASFDDVTLAPVDGDFNVLSDAGFERHFPRADAGNDPADPAVALTVPKGTDINQWAAFQLDQILEAAETYGVSVQLCARGDVFWTWDATIHPDPYATENGYHVPWNDPRHVGYWKRNLRYRIARWGYSPAVLAWEIWNEHGNIPVPSDIHTFYQTVGRFVAELDPFDHLFTTSQGSQAYSPQFWTDTPTGLVNYHDYMTTELQRHPRALTEDAAGFVYVLADDLVRQWPKGVARKPFIWGEIGTLTIWNVSDAVATTGVGGQISRHNFLWAGMFSPIFTSPIDWQTVEKSASTRSLRAFFNGESFSRSGWRTYATTDLNVTTSAGVRASPPALRVLAILNHSNTRLLAWLQHRDHTWAKVARDQRSPTPFTGTFTTPALAAGSYRVEWWSTRSAAVISSRLIEHDGGPLTLTSPVPIADDVAVKVYRPPEERRVSNR